MPKSLSFLLLFLVGAGGCTSSPQPYLYSYPGTNGAEIKRVCDLAVERHGERFMVKAGRISLHMPDHKTLLLTHDRTFLPDGAYACGRLQADKYPCGAQRTSMLSGQPCAFTR